MPLTRPTLPQLIDRNVADIESRLPGSDARLRRSNLNVTARVVAGAAHGLYGSIDFLARQLFPDTAEKEYLERHASARKLTRKVAVAASGPLMLTGTNGSIVPAGTVLTRSDAAEFTTNALATIAAGTATVTLSASVPGDAGNTLAGSQFTFVSPVAGVNSTAVVGAGGLVNGSDAESDTSLRERLIARMQKAPQGGAAFDYVDWALEVPGVTRAWVYPMELGLGTVTVRFMRDDDSTGAVPDAGEVATVAAYLNARKPVTAGLYVVAPTANPLNLSIAVTPNTAAVQAAVRAELVDLIRREAIPGGTLLLTHIREAISIAAGENNYNMPTPAADVTNGVGSITTLGAITWL
jgi:uncharacterized phage protein gp47/JayE